MSPIPRRLALLSAQLLSLALLSGCGGPPAAEIGDTSISSYVALGDGFAAAPYAGSETRRLKGCLRSDGGYPTLLATALEIEDFTDVSCAYAKSGALLGTSTPVRGKVGETVPPQLDAVTADTELVTLTIGFSDRRLLGDLFDLCAEAPCDDEDAPPAGELAGRLDRIANSLIDKVTAIEEKAPDAEIVVVGYPRLAPDEGSCGRMPKLDQTELDAVNAIQSHFNELLSRVARSAGADFVDVAELSVGHDICADEPWVTGRARDDRRELAFHPLPPLQEAITEELVARFGP